jgi:hypothetical protein
MYRIVVTSITILLLWSGCLGVAAAQQKLARVQPVNSKELKEANELDRIINDPVTTYQNTFGNVSITTQVGRRWLKEEWFQKPDSRPFLTILADRSLSGDKIEAMVIAWTKTQDSASRRYFYQGSLVYRELGRLYPATYKYLTRPDSDEVGEVGNQEKDGIVLPAFLRLTEEKKADVEALFDLAKESLSLAINGQKNSPAVVALVTKIYTAKLRREWQGATPPPLPEIK